MTICIASIADLGGEEAIAIATDKMVTLENLGSFEHPVTTKFRKIDKKAGLMLAGYPHLYKEILDKIDGGNDSFKELCEETQEAMENIRDKKLKQQLLEPMGLDKETLWNILASQATPNQLLNRIQEAIVEHNLETQVLIVGFEEGNANIAVVTERNISYMGELNYSVIGSGSTQAINTLLFQKQSKDTDLKTSIYNVFKAKKNSEAHRGVGENTRLCVMYPDGNVVNIKEEERETLKEIYEEELKMGKNDERLKDLGLQKND